MWELVKGMADKTLSAYGIVYPVAVHGFNLLKNCPTHLLPYTHEAEPQMHGYYRGSRFIMLVPFRRESGNDPSGLIIKVASA